MIDEKQLNGLIQGWRERSAHYKTKSRERLESEGLIDSKTLLFLGNELEHCILELSQAMGNSLWDARDQAIGS